MKTWMPFLCAVAVMAGCTKDPEVEAHKPAAEAPKVVVDWDQLEKRDSLWYFEGKPFTGIAVVEKTLLGQKFERPYKDGEPDGLETSWHENGQMKFGTHLEGPQGGRSVDHLVRERAEGVGKQRQGRRKDFRKGMGQRRQPEVTVQSAA